MDNDDSFPYDNPSSDLHTQIENDFINEDELEERREYERRRAAARRRKIAQRERRRKKRRIQAIIRCSILLLIVILIITGFVKMVTGIWKHFHNDKKADKVTEEIAKPTTEEPPAPKIDKKILAKKLPKDREAALAQLKKLSEDNLDIKGIYDNAAIYPDKILQNLAINLEMTDFVVNYPTKINIVFDGEFEVKVPKKKVPLFLQYDERWGYADYGKQIIAINGCAPTCLSMAYTYLKQDGKMNPIKIADFSVENGYLEENGDTSWKLMTEGATSLGLHSEELVLDRKTMMNTLREGKVIICSMKPGDFTKNGHFIVIHSYRDGLFYVNDPNSAARSEVGWDYKRLSEQISNMWAIGN